MALSPKTARSGRNRRLCGFTQLQTVISRENYPVYPGVLTNGSIHGGTVNNIIPIMR